MDSLTTIPRWRAATFVVLAAIGFLAVVSASIWLAAYSTRYIPALASRVGGAAVYMSSLFHPAPTLKVVPTPVPSTPTIPATTTPATSTPSVKPPKHTLPPTPVSRPQTSVQPITTPSIPVTLSGLPDLIVHIDRVGYIPLSMKDTDVVTAASSLVASSTIPLGYMPAAIITVENKGTNTTGVNWNYGVDFQGFKKIEEVGSSLAPSDARQFLLRIDHANLGTNQVLVVTVNQSRTLLESNTDNNIASSSLTILGS